jgi:hypothetical protein
VSAFYYLRGGLATTTASLFLAVSDELLKWQFPVYAAATLLAFLRRYEHVCLPFRSFRVYRNFNE